ncbi:MAG: hypothetical protein Roseis2KO_52650 [Roseivirga sp.]
MELNHKLERIDSLKAELDALGPLDSDAKERLAQKVRMEWNFHSNVIEGNELTYGETRSLLISGITANGKSLKDHLDMKGHNEALKKLEQMAGREVKITESLIREFHEIVLVDPYKDSPDVLVGKYKRTSNYLYNEQGERVDFVPVEEVPEQLNELINWTNNAIFLPKRKKVKYETHPLLIATIFHMGFINIHPFDDGNGRICRIMMNIILLQCGFPPIIIQNEKRQAYFRAIQRSREEKDDSILADFLADELTRSLELYCKAARGEAIEEPDDLDKRIAMLDLKIKGLPGEEVTIGKTEDSMLKVINDSFFPVVILIDEKLEQVESWFLNHHLTIHNGEYFRQFDSLTPDIALDHIFNALKKGTNNVSIQFHYDTLKKGSYDGLGVVSGVVVEFDVSAYKIYDTGRNSVVVKPYDSELNDGEKEIIAQVVVLGLIDTINDTILKIESKEK